MAGGNLSPRQKMINMMYLVLTALLALNISKDILDSLSQLNASMVKSTQTIQKKNELIYANFERAASENPATAGKWNNLAQKVKTESNTLCSDLDELKHELIEVSGGYEEGFGKGTDKAAALDQKSKPANYLLNEKNASKLKTKIEAFRKSMVQFAGQNKNLVSSIESTFETKDEVLETGAKVDWEHKTFDHFPLAAILPFLTDYQAKIRNVETDVISYLEKNIGATDMKFNKVDAVVVANSNYVTQGGEYRAEVFLAAYDSTQVPTITIGENQLDPESIVDGRGIVTFKATTAGPQTWGGVISVKKLGESTPREYIIPEQTFTVAPPSVVISPTKMNVFYRGVDNPVEIAVPGADPNKIRVSGGGVSGSPGKYIARVDGFTGQKEVTVNVGVEETQEDGSTKVVPYGNKKFRIKGLPQAVGTVYQRTDAMLSVNAVRGLEVKAEFQDFPFELPLTVTKFEITIPGFPPETVRGTRLSSGIKTKIAKLRPGSTLTIRKIEARGPGGIKVRKVSNITIDIN